MAKWNVNCKSCGNAFTFSQISDTLADMYFPAKPEFPSEGIERECPNCTSNFTYQSHDLSYQGSEFKGGRRCG
jgi:hypothetical protein